MAADQVAVMYESHHISQSQEPHTCFRKSFGFSEFFLVAHDRGARVSHRLALDYPGVVKKMMLLDICPTLAMYESTDMKFVSSTLSYFANVFYAWYSGRRILALVF